MNVSRNHLKRRRARRRHAGVTLFEVLIVVAILAMVAGGVAVFALPKYREAQSAVLEALKTSPDYPPLLLLSGAINYSIGSFAQAERNLSQFLQKHPDNLQARKLLAATLNAMNQGKQALEVIQPALGQDVQDAALLGLQGNAELRMGDYASAIRRWEQAVALAPKDARLRYNLAISRLSGGDTDRGTRSGQMTLV